MIIEKARELGLALSESEEYALVERTRLAMEADEALMAKLNEYNGKQAEVMELMGADGDNVASVQELSRDISRLHDELLADETFRAVLEAQANFQALMKRVNKVIGMCIGAEQQEDDDEDGCGGNCSHCSGCH